MLHASFPSKCLGAFLLTATCSMFLPNSAYGAWSTEFGDPPGGNGVDDPLLCQILALHGWGGMLIAGGDFSIAGGLSADNIAAWDGEAWIGLGEGLNGTVNTLASYQGDLIAGGLFTASGSVGLSNIARWDGESWTGLGAGTNNRVSALTVFEGELIAGGAFTNAGGQPVSFLAVWNGIQWSPRGDFESRVEDLDVFEGRLIAAGLFDDIDGTPVGHIAHWDGESWSSVGGGANGRVRSVAVHEGRLIAGGLFSSIGLPGVLVNNVAGWDGDSWSALGAGVDAEVRALTLYRNDLIAGGAFLSAGLVPAAHIARWNGAVWSSLGSGLDDIVWSLRQQGGRLFVGGRFTHAGGIPSSRLAGWDDGPIGGDEYLVNADGIGDFRTIQDAAEAAAVFNDLLRVDPADYDEDVVIYEKVIEVIATMSSLRPSLHSFSWQNDDFDSQPDTGGRFEGFRVTDVMADRLSESAEVVNCVVDNSIELQIIQLQDLHVRAVRCTVATRIDLEGGGDEKGSNADVEACLMTGANSSISAFGHNAGVGRSTLLGRGDIFVYGQDAAGVGGCLVSDGDITVFGSNTTSSAVSCSTLSGDIEVGSFVEAAAEANVINGSLDVTAESCTVIGNRLTRGMLRASGDDEVEVSSNVVVGSPDVGIRVSNHSLVTGNTVALCGGAGIRFVSPTEGAVLGTNLSVGNRFGIEILNPESGFTIECNDSWGNAANWVGIFDPTGINGNFSENPRFCDLPGLDLSLASGSVCLPGNHPLGCNTEQIGALGQGCENPTSSAEDTSQSLSSQSAEVLSIHPNPVRGSANVALRWEPGIPLTIRVLDVAGREVGAIFNGMSLDELPIFEWKPGPRVESGVYFVVAEGNGYRYRARVVLVR